MKDVLALLVGEAPDEHLIRHAEALRQAFGSHPSYVLTNVLPSVPYLGGEAAMSAPILQDGILNEALANGAGKEAALLVSLAQLSPASDLVRVDEYPQTVGKRVARLARCFDLFLTHIPGPDDMQSAIFDAVLTGSGSGILALPRTDDRTPALFERIAIAWNGSREASCAIRAALPFLSQANEVVIVLVDQPVRQAGAAERTGGRILSHLKRHGVQANVAQVTSGSLKTAEALLAEVRALGVDLLVLGAQGEGGLLQWFKASVSRDVLERSNIPLLMAH